MGCNSVGVPLPTEMTMEHYRFANFHLDVRRQRLYRDGLPITLTQKCFAILCELVRYAGDIVTRERIADAVWGPGAASDATITQHIAMLRRALHDAGASDVIVTASGHGYRFVEPVVPAENSDTNELVDALCENARYFSRLRSDRALRSAVHLYDRALALKRDAVPALAGKAEALMLTAINAHAPGMPLVGEALEIAEQAIVGDPTDADAAYAYGLALIHHDYDWSRGLRHLDRAIERNPAHEEALIARVLAETYTGAFDAAETHAREARITLPDSHRIRFLLPAVHVFSRRYASGIPELEALCLVRPDYWAAQGLLGIACYWSGAIDDAIARWELVRTGFPDHESLWQPGVRIRVHGYLLHAYATLGRDAEYEALRAQIERLRQTRYFPALTDAFEPLAAGRFDDAMAPIHTSLERRDPWTTRLGIDPFFDPLRDRADFQNILRVLFAHE